MQDVDVQVEGTVQAPSALSPLPLDGPGPAAERGVFRRTPAALPPVFAAFVEFMVTGTEVSGEFRCADCGYGAVVQRVLPPCPMCGGAVWESRPSRFPA